MINFLGCSAQGIAVANGATTLALLEHLVERKILTCRDARAIDVVATITNVRATCTEDDTNVVSTATYDVVATRRDAGQARFAHSIGLRLRKRGHKADQRIAQLFGLGAATLRRRTP